MGEIYLELIVSNINDLSRRRKYRFWWTQVLLSLDSSRSSRKFGIDQAGSVPVELADGTIKEYPYGFCYFTFGEETVARKV